ncbi:unnamed protein product [Acanthoscelides obtectus]|uniref:Uncharacterized protein n=1 Tax=Acanthoscelides obtectus TaxID=200917 RepID=A0A9P0JR72_ACAOB|nr:unnamed protein product [Acanthoscelides obtectus]CAK1679025.1 hypothetical protein AOBTE_LOCUS32094 [Acanthoscelides obtectus]
MEDGFPNDAVLSKVQIAYSGVFVTTKSLRGIALSHLLRQFSFHGTENTCTFGPFP